MIHILLGCLVILQAYSSCQTPQKSIFLSLRSLAGREHMERMFERMSLYVGNYSLDYTQPTTNKSYKIEEFRYRFRYNNHYQKQSFVDQNTVRVLLGRIDLLAQMNYLIKDSQGKVLYQGIQYATSTVDPSYFEKTLKQNEDYVYWQPHSTDLISFSSLWIMQGNFLLPESERYVLQQMLNYIVPTLDINRIIFDQINTLFKQNLRNFLNSDHLFTTHQIPYSYKNISLPLIHKIRNISVNNISQSVNAFVDFEVSDVEQTKCNKIPQTFSQKNYGGIQQIISLSTISFMVLQAIKRGLFNVTLDKSWQSQVFQFYMGDLGNAVSQAEQQDATSPIAIKCQPANISKVMSSQFDQNHLYTQIPQECLIQYKNQIIIKVELYLILLAKLTAQADYLSVKVDKVYSRITKYLSVDPKFVINNSEVAKMVEESLLRKITGIPVFGTNIPLLEKKSPALILLPDYLVIFDASELLPSSKLLMNFDASA